MLKIADNTNPDLRMPQRDDKDRLIDAWKSLALARGVMLDPDNRPNSKIIDDAKERARDAFRIIRALEK